MTPETHAGCAACGKPISLNNDTLVYDKDTGNLYCADCFKETAHKVMEKEHARLRRN